MKTTIYGRKIPKHKGELWFCNRGYEVLLGQITKLFIMHKQVYEKGKPYFDWDDINEKSTKYGFEIILLHEIPEIKNYTKYPYCDIVSKFRTDYFCSSIDYMIAYALYKGYDEIDIGFHFFLGDVDFTDSLWEKCGTEHWLGRAQGMGVKVNNLHGSNIFTTRTGEPYAING